MNTTFIAAFVCYALSSLISMIFGIIYLVRSQFMPYHQEALGKPWEELDHRLQAILLGLMRVVGGGFLATGLSVAILLLIPFRAGETWSRIAIPSIGLVFALPTLYATIFIRSRTKAHTPVAVGSIAVGLFIIGYILSLI